MTVANNTSLCSAILVVFLEFTSVDRAEISHMSTSQNEPARLPGSYEEALNYRKKGQLAQLVRESDLFFRVKRQIKTVLTNVVVEHVKSRMSNAKTRQR